MPSARRGGAPFAAYPAPACRGGVPSSRRRGSTLAARRHPICIGLSLVAAPSHHSSQITGLLSICLCCPLCGSLLCFCQPGLEQQACSTSSCCCLSATLVLHTKAENREGPLFLFASGLFFCGGCRSSSLLLSSPALCCSKCFQYFNMPESTNTIAIAATSGYIAPETWFLDSGASFHVTSDRSKLVACKPVTDGSSINTANGTACHITHQGSL